MNAALINWREIPFVRLLLPFASGILSAAWLPGDGKTAFGFLLGLVLCAALLLPIGKRRLPYTQRWIFGLILNLALICLGRLVGYFSDERQVDGHFSSRLLEENIVSAEVTQVQQRGERLRVQLQVKAIGREAKDIQAARGHLLAYIPIDARLGNCSIGDLIQFRGAISPVPAPQNPKAFDYARYLHFKNIHYQCFVKKGEWTLIPRAGLGSFARHTNAARQYCISVLRRHLPTPNEFGVATALILGYRDETPESLRDAYAATGATHVLAVSGLHVGIVQMVITFLLQFWGRKGRQYKIPKMCVTLLGVWSFALLTGAPSSALRAATMFSFLTVGRAMHRTVNTYNTIAASAFFLLCLNPNLLFDVGFQLSYLAVIGIVFFHPRIYKLWYIENRIGDKVWQLTALSLAATLTTFPVSLLYFHQFPVYFWLSGLVAVPAAGVILGLGLLLFAVQGIPLLGLAVGKLLYGVIWLMNASIFLIQQLPGSRISGVWISTGVAVLLYAMLVAIAIAYVSRKFRWVLGALSIAVLVACIHLLETWKAHQRREIVLYHTRKQTILDFFDGRQVFSLSGNPVTEEEYRFSLQNYRWYARSRPQGTWLLHESPSTQPHWFYRNRLLRFYNIRMAIINHPLPETAGKKIKTDYLLIRDNPRASIRQLAATWDISSGTILLDASNTRNRVKHWLAECEDLGLQCYDVDKRGAWILDIRKTR